MNGDLSLSRSENEALNADDIADIPFLEFSKFLFADIVGTDIDLNPVGIVTDIDKVSLAHITPAHDTSCDFQHIGLHLVKTGFYFFLVTAGSRNDISFVSLVFSLYLAGFGCYVKLCYLIGISIAVFKVSKLFKSYFL